MGNWIHTDLTEIASAPPCNTGAADLARPVGCVRPDGVNTVIFPGNGHIHQLHFDGGSWIHTNLTLATGAPTGPADRTISSPSVCVRRDNVVSIVYASQASHLNALQMTDLDQGTHADISDEAGGSLFFQFGAPTHLLRADGIPAVFYTGRDDKQVHQLALIDGKWTHSNLSELAQAGAGFFLIKAAAYVRPDQITSVVHVNGEQVSSGISTKGIKELALQPDGNWVSTDLSSFPDHPRPHPFGWPTGYLRADGIPSVLYADLEGSLHELTLIDGRWTHVALSQTSNAPKLASGGVPHGPSAYIRGDGVTAVVYRGVDRHIHELTIVGGRWQHADLSLAVPTPDLAGGGFAVPFVRSDGVSSIIYASGGHVHQLALH